MAAFPMHEAPASTDAELGLLCSAFLDPKWTRQKCEEAALQASHFHYPGHATYYALIQEFWAENEPLEDVAFQETLRDRGVFKTLGGRIGGHALTAEAFFTSMRTFVGTAYAAQNYIEIIKSKAARRLINAEAMALAGKALDATMDDSELYGAAEELTLKVVKMKEGKRVHTRDMRELAKRFGDRIEHRRSTDWKVEMPTGIKALDRACLGFKPATVTMILGKPSDGKSSLAMNIAEYLALECGKRVGILSLDDTDDEVFDRLIQQRALVDLFQFEITGKLSADEESRVAQAAIEFGQAHDRLFIRDDGALTPSEMSATFAAWQSKYGLDFGIIDHIQLAKGDGFTRGSTEEASQISRSLKPMAKRFGIPLLVLSQTTEITSNGQTSYRSKNTTSLQEDANRIWTINHIENGTDAWINIGKQKSGPKAGVPVKFQKEFTRFSDRDAAAEEQQPDLVSMPPASRKRTTGKNKA